MADARSDIEADVRRFADLLRWTDGVAVLAAGALLVLLLLARWPE